MLDKDLIITIHDMLVARFGGSLGIRDEALLESAIARPENLSAYNDNASVFAKSASLTYGLIKNHPFVDGNKRIAAVMCEFYLEKENYRLTVSEIEKYKAYIDLITGAITEQDFANWLKTNSEEQV